MRLDPRRPALCVMQATIADADGHAVLVSHAMPAAPFGTPAWQLPILAGYLNQLRRASCPPTSQNLTDYLTTRRGTALPGPLQPYRHNPLHDNRVTCLLDIALTPNGPMGWPYVSLVVIEQEPDRGRCAWSHIERHHSYLNIIAHTADTIREEHRRITERLRTTDDDELRAVQRLAADVTNWIDKIHTAAQADHTLTRAAETRHSITPHH